MFTVIIQRSAQKALRRIPADYRALIEAAFVSLGENPFIGKKLEGQFEGRYTLRIWPYRIIYRIEKKEVTVYVLAVGHRQGVYK